MDRELARADIELGEADRERVTEVLEAALRGHRRFAEPPQRGHLGRGARSHRGTRWSRCGSRSHGHERLG